MNMNTTKTDFATFHRFANINDLIDIAEKHPDLMTGGDEWRYGNNKECNNRELSYNLLRSGRGLSNIRKLSKKYREEFESVNFGKLAERTQSVKRKRIFNDFDGNLDFDRVMVGDVNYWEKTKRNGQAKVIRIGINFALAQGNQIKDFSRIVALSCILAEILESMGYGVEIYGSAIWKVKRKRKKMSGDFIGYLFPVKKATEPLDFDRVYSLGLPALLRDVIFKTEFDIYNEFGGFSVIPPKDVLKSADIDLMIEKSFTDGGKEIEKITKIVNNL